MRNRSGRAVACLCAVLFLLLGPLAAPIVPATPSAPVVQFSDQPFTWQKDERNWWQKTRDGIQRMQQHYYRQLAGAVRNVATTGSQIAAWTLIGLSFAYGVFHAAGPGHGKLVVTSYLVANERAVWRGIALSFASSLMQAVTAIVAVGVVAGFLELTGRAARETVPTLEAISYGLVIALGFYLLFRSLRRWFRLRERIEEQDKALAADAGPVLSAHPEQAIDAARHPHPAYWEKPDDAAPAPNHEHDHEHDHDHHGHNHDHHGHDHHGHVHLPPPAEIQKASLGEMAFMVLAVGLRPCTGGILVMIFALALGSYWVGVMSVFAMSIGTAITVTLLALITVFAKRLALRAAALSERRWLSYVQLGFEVAGSIALMTFGAFLLSASLTTPSSPF